MDEQKLANALAFLKRLYKFEEEREEKRKARADEWPTRELGPDEELDFGPQPTTIYLWDYPSYSDYLRHKKQYLDKAEE